jgi:hypothetical protein
MIIFVFTIKLFENKLNIFTKNINETKIIAYIAPNLYDYNSVVSSEKIIVIDYFIKDNKLCVKPYNNEIVLPINGLISKCNTNNIIISTTLSTYLRSNVINKDVYLYQYYNSHTNIGKTDDYFIISGNNLDLIVRSLSIENINA